MNHSPILKNKWMKPFIIIFIVMILILSALIITQIQSALLLNVHGLSEQTSLKTISRNSDSPKIARVLLEKEGTPVSEFDLNTFENINLEGMRAEYNLEETKGLMHTTTNSLSNIELYIPRKPYQTQVRICVNASNLEEIYSGCSELDNIPQEYVLKLGEPNLRLSENENFFIVSNITGTGGVGESDWWNSSYQRRKLLNITPTNANLTKGYTINVSIDTSTLISTSKLRLNGTDLRVVYWNGSTNFELDRTNSTSFNTTSTIIEFKVQRNITNESLQYYIYYDNPSAGTPPENKSKIYYLWEDFEDQAHEFTDGPLNPVVNTGSKKNGNYGLEGDGLAGYSRAVKPEILARGMSIEGWVYSGYAGDNADMPGFTFGMQPTGDQKNGYQVVLDWRSATGGSADMQIRENWGSGTPLATSTQNTTVADAWYYIIVYWKSNGDINSTIYNSNMHYFGSLNANDPSYTSGYYGVGAYRDGFWDDVKVKLHVINTPVIIIGTEELNGPGINNYTYSPFIIHRNETVEINANITTSNGMSQAWINITLPNNTIIKEFMSNISSIYTLSYVSTQIGNYSSKIYANDTNGTTSESRETLNWLSYGWAEINESNISSNTIYQGDNVLINCKISDSNTSEGIYNYTVHYYRNETGLIGTKQTNSNGWATYNLTDNTLGNEIITCNITDNSNLFYYKSNNYSSIFNLQTLEPPVLTILTSNGTEKTGFGNNITIESRITSPFSIENVRSNITKPDGTSELINLSFVSGNTYRGKFTNTWLNGNYSYYIWANDSNGTIKTSSPSENFEIASSIDIVLQTNDISYGPNTNVSLTQGVTGWWDGAYKYRKRITVTNNDASLLKENYSVKININTAALISQNKMLANCNDLRIVWSNGTSQKQLDRINETSCNSASTEIWFALNNNISSHGTDNNYYIYYGKSSASNPPDDRDKIYLVWDNFENYDENATPINGWTYDPEYGTNNWQIKLDSGNKVVQDIATDGVYHRLWKGYDGWNDYQIEAKVKLDAFLFSGITYRRQPLNSSYYNHYSLITDDRAASNKLTIRRWYGGGSNFVQIAGDNTDFDGLAWNNYTIRILGDNVKESRNGIQYINYNISGSTPTFLSGSYIGLMSHQGQTMFDDIKVRLIVNNEPTLSSSSEEIKALSSEINELEESEHYLYLLITVQNNDTEIWNDVTVVLNDSATGTRRHLGTGSTLDLSSIWTTLGNWNTKSNSTGNYRIYVAAIDNTGKLLINSNTNPIEQNSSFRIDTSAPNVILINPQTNTGDNDGQVMFEYNVSDDTDINNCALFINNSEYSKDYSITKDVPQYFNTNLNSGSYTWKIKCSDQYGGIGTSSTNKIIIIQTNNYNGSTTNLSNLDVENISNFVIENPTYGKINFTQTINLSSGANINSYVTIGNNLIRINTNLLPALNKSAMLKLYNLNFSNPILLKDDQICQDCIISDYSSNILTFNVTSFSSYSATENSQLNIWDDSDLEIKLSGENVNFYANYSNTSSGAPIIGASCSITFNDMSDTMIYNSGIYSYNRSFNSSNVFFFNVSCDGSGQGYAIINGTDYTSINSPTGPKGANITLIGSERANFTEVISAQVITGASNVTQLLINTTSITNSWQGYYGIIRGDITLKNSDGASFYNWNITTPQGEVYASRALDVNFPTVKCSNSTSMENENNFVGNNPNADDSVFNTFNSLSHPEFSVGAVNISANSCPSTNLYISNTSQNTNFYEVILTDGAENVVYTALIDANQTGFNTNIYDFQMIVGENGHDGDEELTPYYFFIEIN